MYSGESGSNVMDSEGSKSSFGFMFDNKFRKSQDKSPSIPDNKFRKSQDKSPSIASFLKNS